MIEPKRLSVRFAKAQKTIDGIRGAGISEQKVELADDGTIKHFRVDMKLTFLLED